MKRMYLTVAMFLVVCTALAAASRHTGRAAMVLICADAESGVLRTAGGAFVQRLTFDEMGQVAAGPVPAGAYTVEAGPWQASFTLRANAAVTGVTGDGWSDGESVRLGEWTETRLTVYFDGPWRWTLEGEGADRAVPELKQTDGRSCCVFRLPPGVYVLRGETGSLPIALTPEDPSRTVSLDE